MNYQFQVSSTRVVFGIGTAASAGREAATLGIRRALLVTDPFMASQPACAALITNLRNAGIAVEVFADVEPDPSSECIENGADAYRIAGADGIVALGGGSAMDTAKGLGVLASAGARHIMPFVFGGSDTPRGIPPLLCLPTTAGTGSEVTFVAIVTEPVTRRKLLVRHPSIAPTVAIVDPELSASMPATLTAYTGMDALSHALEGMTATLASPLADSLALSAIPPIVQHLPRAVADGSDIEARSALAHAATAAGFAFLSGRVHLGHAIGHAFGGAYHLPHGLACIVCMPEIIRLITPACPAKIDQIAAAMGIPDAAHVPVAIAGLMEQCGIPTLGSVLAAHRPNISELVELVKGEARLIRLSPHQPTDAEWQQIFEASW